MLVLGHIGFTISAVKATEKIIDHKKALFDYRIVIIGSILPDIIDKIILFFINNETMYSGRIFAHSLLFSLLCTSIGLMMYYNNKNKGLWILTLAYCSLIHQLLDDMWRQLDVFLFPFYQFTQQIQNFPSQAAIPPAVSESGAIHFTWNFISSLLMKPYFLITEILGAFIITYFFILLIRKKQLKHFIKVGH